MRDRPPRPPHPRTPPHLGRIDTSFPHTTSRYREVNSGGAGGQGEVEARLVVPVPGPDERARDGPQDPRVQGRRARQHLVDVVRVRRRPRRHLDGVPAPQPGQVPEGLAVRVPVPGEREVPGPARLLGAAVVPDVPFVQHVRRAHALGDGDAQVQPGNGEHGVRPGAPGRGGGVSGRRGAREVPGWRPAPGRRPYRNRRAGRRGRPPYRSPTPVPAPPPCARPRAGPPGWSTTAGARPAAGGPARPSRAARPPLRSTRRSRSRPRRSPCRTTRAPAAVRIRATSARSRPHDRPVAPNSPEPAGRPLRAGPAARLSQRV